MSEAKKTRVVIQNVRLSYPNLHKKTQYMRNGKPEGEPAYNAAFIFGKKHPDLAKLLEAEKEVARLKWGSKADTQLNIIKSKDMSFIHDGDGKPDKNGYPGNFYINARNKNIVKVYDSKTNDSKPLTAEDYRPYAGCYVHAILEIWADDTNKRINACLVGVMWYKDGEAFSGGKPADVNEFADAAEDEPMDEDEINRLAG